MITVTIDGNEIKVKKGITVLEAIQEAGIYIPTLMSSPQFIPLWQLSVLWRLTG